MAKQVAAKPIGDKPASEVLASATKAKGAAKAKEPAAPAVVAETTTKPLVISIDLKLSKDNLVKAIDKAVLSIKTRGAKLDADIHSAAVAALFHCGEYRDNTLVNRLLLAMPKSSRRNALAQWFAAFGMLSDWPTETAAERKTAAEKRETQPLMFDKTKTTRLDDAKATPFWDFKNVREGTATFEFDDYIGNVMKKLEKLAKGDTPDAARARATLSAISGVAQALHVPPEPVTLEPGQPVPLRRASDHAAPATVQ